jgi:hypothetical protein
MNNYISMFQDNLYLIVFYGFSLNILAFIIIIIQGIRIKKLNKKLKNLTRGIEGKNLEEIVRQYFDKIDSIDIRMNKLDIQTTKIEEKLLNCIQKIGIVRYNAYDNVGGELSFSMTILDEENNGVILTSIFGRNNSCIYGKPIKKGRSNFTLSAEELQSLDRAKNNSLDEYSKMIS